MFRRRTLNVTSLVQRLASMIGSSISHRAALIAALGLIFSLVASTAPAQGVFTWSGTGSTTWSSTANWWNAAVPGAGDIALFNSGTYTNQPTLTANQAVGAVWDNGTGTVAISANTLTINGATIDGNAGSGVVLESGAGSLTIGSGVLLGAAQTWYNNTSGPSNLLNVTGAVNNNGNLLTVTGAGNSSFSGIISGTGGFTQNGTGITTLTGANTFTGTATISAGTLAVRGTAFSTTARTWSIAPGAALSLSLSSLATTYNTNSVPNGTTTIYGGGTSL